MVLTLYVDIGLNYPVRSNTCRQFDSENVFDLYAGSKIEIVYENKVMAVNKDACANMGVY